MHLMDLSDGLWSTSTGGFIWPVSSGGPHLLVSSDVLGLGFLHMKAVTLDTIKSDIWRIFWFNKTLLFTLNIQWIKTKFHPSNFYMKSRLNLPIWILGTIQRLSTFATTTIVVKPPMKNMAQISNWSQPFWIFNISDATLEAHPKLLQKETGGELKGIIHLGWEKSADLTKLDQTAWRNKWWVGFAISAKGGYIKMDLNGRIQVWEKIFTNTKPNLWVLFNYYKIILGSISVWFQLYRKLLKLT